MTRQAAASAASAAAAASARRRPELGIVEWFHFGDRGHVERTLARMKALKIRHLRTGVSWADWHVPGADAWFDWLLPRLAREVELVPCFVYTPPSLGRLPRTSSPPRDPQAFAAFIDQMITLYGHCFDWVELWNEPNNAKEWDYTLDPEWRAFGEMVGSAARWAKHRGKRTILGGMSPVDPNWLETMFHRGVMDHIDVVGIHAFPGTWEVTWEGWQKEFRRTQDVLDRHGHGAPVWLTEAGYSTWDLEEVHQLDLLLDLLEAPTQRAYWYTMEDIPPHRSAAGGFHQDEREYHFGLWDTHNRPKLLPHLFAHGIDALPSLRWLVQETERLPDGGHTVVTGGAGFVGVNLADRLLREDRDVLLVDNLSRPGSLDNLLWLRRQHGPRAKVHVADVRARFTADRALRGAASVFHLAAQVAVTTSLDDPLHDHATNVLGTLKLLEAARRASEPPAFVFASTNKVYGCLDHVPLEARDGRWEPVDGTLRRHGVGEVPLEFRTPYGCSKGAADQYVLDHARTYGLPATAFRMSCIYGPHQNGTEDQGWVAHFLLQARRNAPIVLYGDGRQVRDVLYVDDLVDAFLRAESRIRSVSGRAFNVGGGPAHTTSLLELLERMRAMGLRVPEVQHAPPRPGDQRYYVSDVRAAAEALDWQPRTPFPEGLARLWRWLEEGAPEAVPHAIEVAA